MQATLKIGTRASKLALWQAKWVKELLEKSNPSLQIELVPITTTGDQKLEVTLNKIGGKGLFLKEIEEALISGEVDLAVHSMKDIPNHLPKNLEINAYLPRENPLDAYVTNSDKNFTDLPSGSKIGSSSLRRICQLQLLRSDLEYIPLRGNLQTRLKKLDQNDFDAIVLASAGLIRLDLKQRIFSELDIVPASGQGVVAIETRQDDLRTKKYVQKLNNEMSATCVEAERIFLKKLEGGCQTPIGSWVYPANKDYFIFKGFLSNLNSSEFIYYQDKIHYSNLFKQIEEITNKQFLNSKGEKILASFRG